MKYCLVIYILKEFSQKYMECDFYKVDVDVNDVSYNATWRAWVTWVSCNTGSSGRAGRYCYAHFYFLSQQQKGKVMCVARLLLEFIVKCTH